MGKSDMRFTLQTGYHPATRIALVECKGQGHPDTLADNLAEELSRAYAQWTFKEFGAVLHHNFDKLALLGGLSEVRYGSGRMMAPVRVLVNGRAARCCGPVMVPVEDLITETVRQFFAQRLPELTGHLSLELNVTTHSSPGAVYVNDASPERASWFAPESTEGLRELRALIANDTSFGTGWAPEDPAESFARDLADVLSSLGFRGFRQRVARRLPRPAG